MGLFDMLKSAAGKAIGDALTEGLKKKDDGTQDKNVSEVFSALGELAKNVADNVKVCPKCGTHVPSDGVFCPNCGTKVVTLSEAEGLEGRDLGQEIKNSFSPASSGRYSEATIASIGPDMPNEPNMYNYSGTPEAYLSEIFSTEFAAYDVRKTIGYGGRTIVYTFYRGAYTALVVELLPNNTGSVKLREKCRAEGTPYLRFYYGHNGWWNTRRYVTERVSSALGI